MTNDKTNLSKEFERILKFPPKEKPIRISDLQKAIEKLFIFYGVDKGSAYEMMDFRKIIIDCVKVGYSAGLLSTLKFKDEEGAVIQDKFWVKCGDKI